MGTGSRAPNGSRIPPKYAKQCRKWEVGGDKLLPIALLLESGVGGCMLAAMGQYIFKSSQFQLLNSRVITIEIGAGQKWDGVYIEAKEMNGWDVLK